MDLGSNPPAANNTSSAAAAAVKGGDVQESETPAAARISAVKPLSFSSNGVLKRHNSLHHHNHHAVVVVYKECLKNHAASIGGHAVDGCGEFMPSPTANPADPTSLKCAACGCHRNFHRREPDEPLAPPSAAPALEYQPHHRHHPPPPPPPPHDHSSPNSPSPPPISSSYYPSAPHMLLALSTGLSGHPAADNTTTPISAPSSAHMKGRKRFRTKFTQDQKDKMLDFAERVGWKIQKRDEELINDFCREIGVERGVLKVWMHNNKNTVGKRDNITTTTPPAAAACGGGGGPTENGNSHSLGFDIGRVNSAPLTSDNNGSHSQNHYALHGGGDVLAANGSSSSS
nr:zinc-finger homeodomain protein 9-like [Ipomoea trifida]